VINLHKHKQGALWRDLIDKRMNKQHPGGKIPKGDNHAVHTYANPVLPNQSQTSETDLTKIAVKVQTAKEAPENNQPIPDTYPKIPLDPAIREPEDNDY
jgi:hypothetical protein